MPWNEMKYYEQPVSMTWIHVLPQLRNACFHTSWGSGYGRWQQWNHVGFWGLSCEHAPHGFISRATRLKCIFLFFLFFFIVGKQTDGKWTSPWFYPCLKTNVKVCDLETAKIWFLKALFQINIFSNVRWFNCITIHTSMDSKFGERVAQIRSTDSPIPWCFQEIYIFYCDKLVLFMIV